MQLDHLNIYVKDVKLSRSLYEPVFKEFGYDVVRDFEEIAVGFGDGDYSVLALVRTRKPIEGAHFAFRVETRSDVDRFHALAIDAGGTDNGEPGLRPNYHENYYAAFVRDYDGNNMEFVCHEADT